MGFPGGGILKCGCLNQCVCVVFVCGLVFINASLLGICDYTQLC